MADTNNFDRPTIQMQSYAKTPKYSCHGAADDRLAILVCRIKIWECTNKKWFDIPDCQNCLVIREAESIEINHAYNELIGKAVIRFPRGTVVEKRYASTIISNDSGNGNNTISSTMIKDATADGDFLEYRMNQINPQNKATDTIKPKKGIVLLDGSQVDNGLLKINKYKDIESLLAPNDFSIGNRIEIYLGYAYSDEEFKKMQADTNKVPVNMEMMFTGFITSISASTPIEIECENMAHVLTTVNVPDVMSKGKLKLSDFLPDDSQFHLLKGTGLSVSKAVSNDVIEISKVHISSQLTVADVFAEWHKSGIVSFMENNSDGTSTLRIGRAYYVGTNGNSLPTKDKQYITYTENAQYHIIQFDWDVAEDKLSLANTDKKYLAVRANGVNADGKYISFVLRKTSTNSEEWVMSDDDESWSVVNEKTPQKRKARKRKDGTRGTPPKGTTNATKMKNKVDLSNYNVIQYISPTKPITKEKLMVEAKQYWKKYVPNGISGTLSIFGDLPIKPSQIIGLIDPRNPQKNGYYFVESVNTTFDTSGYRKELKLPYKVAKFSDYPVYQI